MSFHHHFITLTSLTLLCRLLSLVSGFYSHRHLFLFAAFAFAFASADDAHTAVLAVASDSRCEFPSQASSFTSPLIVIRLSSSSRLHSSQHGFLHQLRHFLRLSPVAPSRDDLHPASFITSSVGFITFVVGIVTVIFGNSPTVSLLVKLYATTVAPSCSPLL